MKRSGSKAPECASGSVHQETIAPSPPDVPASSASEIRSRAAITWAMALRRPFGQVRAEMNPARWAASCTLSENAMTLWSSLCRDPNTCPSATLSRLEARAPKMMSASCAPQKGQSRLRRKVGWPRRGEKGLVASGRKTFASCSETPQPEQSSTSCPGMRHRQDAHSVTGWLRVPAGGSSGKR